MQIKQLPNLSDDLSLVIFVSIMKESIKQGNKITLYRNGDAILEESVEPFLVLRAIDEGADSIGITKRVIN